MLLVIIDNLHIRWPRRPAGPLEAYAPLIVDAYAVLALAVAMQRFKTVAGQRGKVCERRGRLQTVQLQARGTFDSGEGLDALSARELSGPLIPIADDHFQKLAGVTRYVKRTRRATWLMEAGKAPEESAVVIPASQHRRRAFCARRLLEGAAAKLAQSLICRPPASHERGISFLPHRVSNWGAGVPIMERITIDPRDFISGPFRKCPKCGAEQFGVLMVSGNLYVRRCRDRACWHTQRIYLPEIRKRIIYLDQFAISNMMKALNPDVKGHERAAADPFWRELFEALYVVCRLQLVVCPDSNEHRNESLLSSFYAPLKRMYELLSHGATFHDSETIRHQQVATIAEAWIHGEVPKFNFDAQEVSYGRLHEWQERFIISANIEYADLVDGIRGEREKVHEGLGKCFVTWQKEKPSFAACFEEEITAWGPGIFRIYLNWVQHRIEMEQGNRPIDLEAYMPPQCAGLIIGIKYIFQRAGVPEPDSFSKAREFLLSRAPTEAPFNRIAASLFAVMAAKAAAGQKEPPNRGTAADVNIVSTLLPYCDAMFIDNKCRALLSDIPQAHRLPYSTHIFSLKQGKEFLEYLNNIKDACTPQHIGLVEEVYGPGWKEPYLSIFRPEK